MISEEELESRQRKISESMMEAEEKEWEEFRDEKDPLSKIKFIVHKRKQNEGGMTEEEFARAFIGTYD